MQMGHGDDDQRVVIDTIDQTVREDSVEFPARFPERIVENLLPALLPYRVRQGILGRCLHLVGYTS
jgi:hypothetical protein